MKVGKCVSHILLVTTVFVLTGCAVVPRPFTLEEVDERVRKDRQEMFKDQEPVTKPVTLYEAMARAIKYNLDHRLKLMESVLASNQLEVAKYDLLPSLSARAGYNNRNNEQGSTSIALTGPNAGTESLVMSTSRERDARTANIEIVWNVLDFGVSYIRTKQDADKILIIEERRRKVIQNILQEVRYAYWRAASAEYLVDDMLDMLERSKSALERSRKIEGQRLKTPRGSLEYQKALLENIRLLWSLIQKLKPAKSELAALINIDPGTPFRIAQPEWDSGDDLPLFNVPVEELAHIALVNRPEILENDYKHRISTLEAKKAIFNMLPGVELDFGYSYDSNKYLYNNNWVEAGTSIAWNIFDGLLKGPANHRAAKSQAEVDIMSRRALSMAILAQVHLAYQRYHLIQEEYSVSKQLNEVNRQLQLQSMAEKAAGSVHEMTLIHDATNALLAKMRDHMGYADLQNAAGRIYSTLGIDILPDEVNSLEIDSISTELKEAFAEQKKNFEQITTSGPDLMDESPVLVSPKQTDAEEGMPGAQPEPATTLEIVEPAVVEEDIEEPLPVETVADKEPVAEEMVEAMPVEEEAVTRLEAVITGDRVNMRKGPSRRDKVVCMIAEKGTIVEVLGEQEDGWFKVKLDDKEGWIYKSLLNLDTAMPEPEEYEYKDGVVKGYLINMRKGPSEEYVVLFRLSGGTAVTLLGDQEDGWVKVKLGNKSGWINGKYVEEK